MDEAVPRLPPRRQQRGRRRVAAILEAAAALFAARGIEGTTMSAIASESGTAIGSLYQFFPNRQAIVGALAEQYLADWHRMRADIAARRPADDLAASIDAGIDARVKFHIDHAAVARLLETDRETARSLNELQTELEGAVAFLTHYGPGIPKSKLRVYAQLINAMVNGMMATIVHEALTESQRAALVAELKSAIHVYLEPRLHR